MMKKCIQVLVLVLAVSTTKISAQTPTAVSYEALTVAATAVPITAAILRPAVGAVTTCSFTVLTADIRFLFEGSTPTAGVGIIAYAGQSFLLSGLGNLDRFLAIRTGSTSAVVTIVCSRGTSSNSSPLEFMARAGGSTGTPLLAPDGTASLPAYSFASEPTLGFWRSTAATVTLQGALNVNGGGDITSQGGVFAGPSSRIAFAGRGGLAAPGDGNFTLRVNGTTIGSQFKVDALPTVSACGAGSPAVTAGSTPMTGSVTIGTTAVVTCLITFNGTAYPSVAHCSGSVATSTAANTRAMGYLATTTTLTIVPETAWVDSSVVTWHCFSAKA